MPIDPADAALAEAIADHTIPVNDPPPPEPEPVPVRVPVPEEPDAPESPEEKLNLAGNPDQFVLDVPPRDGF